MNDDNDGPAFVSSRMSREMIEKYERWRRLTNPHDDEKGMLVGLREDGEIAEFWLSHGERLTMEQYRRLVPSSFERMQPHQLPEELD